MQNQARLEIPEIEIEPSAIAADVTIPAVAEAVETVGADAPGRARKAELLAEAANQFCALKRPDRNEITVFKEFFYQLIDGCDKAERRKLAVAIAANAYVPRPIVFYLAMDDKEIAAPVLLFSPVLNEADIVLLAGRLGFDHLQVLCRRDDLTPAAASALIANGGPPAAAILARNAKTANLSVAGLMDRKAVENRKAEPAPPVPAETGAPEGGDAKVVPFEPAKPVREQVVDLAGRGGRLGHSAPSDRLAQASRMHRAKVATDAEPDLTQALIEAARARDHQQLAELIAAEAGCSPRPVANLLCEPTDESVGVLLKGIGIDPISASQLLLLLVPGASDAESGILTKAIGTFRRLDGGECREFIKMLGGMSPREEAAPAGDGDAFARALDERRREISGPAAPRYRDQLIAARGAGRPFGKAGRTASR